MMLWYLRESCRFDRRTDKPAVRVASSIHKIIHFDLKSKYLTYFECSERVCKIILFFLRFFTFIVNKLLDDDLPVGEGVQLLAPLDLPARLTKQGGNTAQWLTGLATHPEIGYSSRDRAFKPRRYS